MFQKLYKQVVFISVTLGILLLIIWVYAADPIAYPADEITYNITLDGWTQILEEESILLDDIQNFIPVEEGDALILEYTLPTINDGDVFLLYADNQEVIAYVNDICIHSFSMTDELSFLKTPGSAWNQIELTSDMSGQVIRLEISSPLYSYNNNLNDIYFIESSSVVYVRLDTIWFHCVCAVLIVFLAFAALINGYIWKTQRYRRDYFISLSSLYFTVLLWILSQLNFYDLFFHRPLLSYLLGMVFLRLIPYALYRFLFRDTTLFPHIRKIIHIVALCNVYMPWFLQFTCGISLLETQWFNTLVLFLIIALYTVVILYKLFERQNQIPLDYSRTVFSIIFLGIGIDYFIFYIFEATNISMMGVASITSCVLYSLITYIGFSYQGYTTAIEKYALETSYQKLQTATLMEQIKAHFIFNTLNTISALCKRDARAADKAIKLFAKYLRSYMYLINQTENIPFSDEIELVEAYLSIEKMRFQEHFSFEMNIDYVDFKLPALSIQPIIENAVVHGIRTQYQDGNIRISTRLIDNNIVLLTIQDNGVGFDTNILDSKNSIGIPNIKKRLHTMVNGDLTIRSELNIGTEVEIRIPLMPH